jgi:hypothetical protein
MIKGETLRILGCREPIRERRPQVTRWKMFYTRGLIATAVLLAAIPGAHAQSPASPPSPRGGSMQDMRGAANAHESAKEAGIVGIALALEADAVGAPGRLVVRAVERQSPAHYAGIMRGDRIVTVDGQPVDGKKLDDVASAIRGEVGSPVKLGLDREGSAREVTLTRVEPERRMAGRGGMRGMRGMMDMIPMHQGMMGSGPGGDAVVPPSWSQR